MRNFISGQELEPKRRRYNYKKPPRRIRNRQQLCSLQQLFRIPSFLSFYLYCLLFYLNPSNTPHYILPAIISSSSVLPLPGITLLLFYQPEPWIKPSSGKNLIIFKYTRDLWGGRVGRVEQVQKTKSSFHFCYSILCDLRQVISHLWASLSSSENEIQYN